MKGWPKIGSIFQGIFRVADQAERGTVLDQLDDQGRTVGTFYVIRIGRGATEWVRNRAKPSKRKHWRN